MNAVAAMKHYKQVSVHSNLMDASPHRLVQMLMEGVLEKVAEAKGNMINQYIAKKGKDIGTAISIIAGLQSSLNKDADLLCIGCQIITQETQGANIARRKEVNISSPTLVSMDFPDQKNPPAPQKIKNNSDIRCPSLTIS